MDEKATAQADGEVEKNRVAIQEGQYSPNSDWKLIKRMALRGQFTDGWKLNRIIIDQSSVVVCKYGKKSDGSDAMIGALLVVEGMGVSEVICSEKEPLCVNVEYDLNGNVKSTDEMSLDRINYFGAMITRLLRKNGKL